MLHLLVNSKNIKYSKICSFYNDHKDSSWNTIQPLKRLEGGFYICVNANKNLEEAQYSNKDIKQVRWMSKRLVTPKGLNEFTLPELTLLYKSIAHVHGEENVFLECGPIRN